MQGPNAYPRAAKNVPLVNSEFLSELLCIFNKIPGSVLLQTGARCRFAGPALVVENDLHDAIGSTGNAILRAIHVPCISPD